MPKELPGGCRIAPHDIDNALNLSLDGAAGESMTENEALQRRLATEQFERNVRGSVAASKEKTPVSEGLSVSKIAPTSQGKVTQRKA